MVCYILLWLLAPVVAQLPNYTRPTPEELRLYDNRPLEIRVGVLITIEAERPVKRMSYKGSIAAINIALDRIREEHLLDNYNFTFFVRFDDCKEMYAAGYAAQLVAEQKVNILIGPVCNPAAILASSVAASANVPLMGWGLTSTYELADKARFPTTTTVAISANQAAKSIIAVMEHFGWDRFAFIYIMYTGDTELRCQHFNKELIAAVQSSTSNILISFTRMVIDATRESLGDALKEASKYARIFVQCYNNDYYKRLSLIVLKDLGFDNPEYVAIIMETSALGFGTRYRYETDVDERMQSQPLWYAEPSFADGLDEYAKEGARYSFFVDGFVNNSRTRMEAFVKAYGNRERDWPWFCPDCDTNNYNISNYCYDLHDTFYMYGLALNRTLEKDPINGLHDGRALVENAKGSFDGYNGHVKINSLGMRDAKFGMYGINADGKVAEFLVIDFEESVPQVITNYVDESTSIWATRSGIRPPSVPVCGFTGSVCPKQVWNALAPYVYSIIGVLVLSLLLILIYGLHFRHAEKIRLNALWRISFLELSHVKKVEAASQYSLQSKSSSTSNISGAVESRSYAYFYFRSEPVAARKFQNRQVLDEKLCAELRKMTQLSHDNLCKFIGLCSDGPQTFAIFRYCSRRSLRDLIADEKYPMDAFFLRSISLDIVHGLMCLMKVDYCKGHGRLTSRTIVVDDRWVVKLTDYGLHELHKGEKVNRRELLWRAPEMIRNPELTPNEAADVYSFGIICSEVLTKKTPFGVENANEIDDAIYRIKRGGTDALKPDLSTVSVPDLPPSVIAVIKECYMDNPKARPSLTLLQNVLRSGGSTNESLMDHIFATVESYADTLTNEVAQRSGELTEEKKKSDLLLYRMLPKQVAESLKRGMPVQPENYDTVTVFFSDVVQFTQLSSQCTPLQVVNLLNDLYTLFDTVIENHDVYKVETIGDGYLCVSGLPHRNGIDHVKQIALMSLTLMQTIGAFRIPHLPDERIKIRIGAHSGAVTAAVVGLSMPRYCLFGDTVNTASRMESNGKPSMIQISSATNALLMQVGGFVTELRGDVIIKGKGVMETFWLLKKVDDKYDNADILGVKKETNRKGSRTSTATTVSQT